MTEDVGMVFGGVVVVVCVSPRRYQNNYCIVGLNLGAVLKIHGVELI
jgi:hypothetical protein